MTRLGPTRLAILAMVADGHKTGRRLTLKAMALRLGFASPNSVHEHLLALRAAGYVTWQYGKKATVVPTFKFIPASELER